MITHIKIDIDGHQWERNLRGKVRPKVVAAAIADVTSAYPTFTRKLITITYISRTRTCLTWIADRWLAVRPAIRLAWFVIALTMIVIGLL